MVFQGFKDLVRRDWIGFGHKFADRTGTRSSVSGESSPVFLQWLDCVHQLHQLFPDAFQFTLSYLVRNFMCFKVVEIQEILKIK